MSDQDFSSFDFERTEAERAAAAEKMRQREHQLDTDYVHLMNSFAGRRVIADLIAPLWRSSYQGVREHTDFMEGERNVALRVWARLTRVCPTLAHKLIEETLQ